MKCFKNLYSIEAEVDPSTSKSAIIPILCFFSIASITLDEALSISFKFPGLGIPPVATRGSIAANTILGSRFQRSLILRTRNLNKAYSY